MPTKILVESYIYYISDAGVCLRLVKAHESDGWFIFSGGKMHFEKKIFLIVEPWEPAEKVKTGKLGRYPEVGEKFWLEVECDMEPDVDGDLTVFSVAEGCYSGKLWLSSNTFFEDPRVGELIHLERQVAKLKQELGR